MGVTFCGPVTVSAEHVELRGRAVLFSDSSCSSMEDGLKKKNGSNMVGALFGWWGPRTSL